MSDRIQRALLLLGRSRYDLAAREVRAELAEDPENSAAHAILALILSDKGKPAEALKAAQRAVSLGPELPFCHFAMSLVLEAQEKHAAAVGAVCEAIRLDPEDADYHGQLASIRLGQEKWKSALRSAENGLRLDPEHTDCLNYRAMALMRLGRKEEADEAARSALAGAPDDAELHATRGWTLLDASRHKQAIESFREALRLDPESERARRGIIAALKARNPAYRLLLRYLLWMSRLSGKARWAFIIGLYLGARALRYTALKRPELAPYVWPLLGAYVLFVFVSWVGEPLSNLVLMTNRLGRLALSRRERVAAFGLGACLLVAAAGFGAGLVLDEILLLLAGGWGLTMSIPTAGSLGCAPGRSRKILLAYAAGLAVVGLATIGLTTINSPLTFPLMMVYLFGWLGFSWVANIIQK